MSAPVEPGQHGDTRSVGAIVSDIANDLTSMVRSEIELAKVEAKQEAIDAGKAGGLFGAAAVCGYFTLLFLSLFAMCLLGEAMDLQWAALIVTAVYALAAGALALVGRNNLRKTNPPLEKTQQTIKEDVAWAKNQK